MTKLEIFNKIAEICAAVCNVSVEDKMSGSRKEDVVTARSPLIFWCDAAGFSVESLVVCTDSNYANSINSVKAKIEEFWRERFAYHILAKEIGKACGIDPYGEEICYLAGYIAQQIHHHASQLLRTHCLQNTKDRLSH